MRKSRNSRGACAAAVVVAAGASTRMKSPVRKPFMKIGGREILAWTVENLARVRAIRFFVIVVRPEDEAVARRILSRVKALAGREVRFAPGGPRRQDSVLNGLKACGDDASLVAIHDAARPLVPPENVERAIEAAAKIGGAILACPVRDTLKAVAPDGLILRTVPRDGLYAAQTPQVFRLDELRELMERACRENREFTDDAGVFEAYGKPVLVVDSGPENLKITSRCDLKIASAGLKAARRWCGRQKDRRGAAGGTAT